MKKIVVSIVESSELKLPKISRLHMGDYLCVASNGIPPSTSKKYRIRVQCELMFTLNYLGTVGLPLQGFIISMK